MEHRDRTEHRRCRRFSQCLSRSRLFCAAQQGSAAAASSFISSDSSARYRGFRRVLAGPAPHPAAAADSPFQPSSPLRKAIRRHQPALRMAAQGLLTARCGGFCAGSRRLSSGSSPTTSVGCPTPSWRTSLAVPHDRPAALDYRWAPDRCPVRRPHRRGGTTHSPGVTTRAGPSVGRPPPSPLSPSRGNATNMRKSNMRHYR